MNTTALSKDCNLDRIVRTAKRRRFRRRAGRLAVATATLCLAVFVQPWGDPAPPANRDVAMATSEEPAPPAVAETIATDAALLDALDGAGAIIVTRADGVKFLVVNTHR